MVTFWDILEEYLGGADDMTDIRAIVRRCWFYDFKGFPLRVWQGQGKLYTPDGNEWLGTIDANGNDLHKTPSISDGRDGSSATYTFTLNIVDVPNQPVRQMYDAIKAEQWRTTGRKITCYLGVFKPGEALRPETPVIFFKEFLMMSPKFSEKIDTSSDGAFIKKYSASVIAKDNNFGRSNVPGGTYSDTTQKDRARQLGISLDRGCEFVALLANKTMTPP